MKKKLSIAGVILVLIALLAIRVITGRQKVSEVSVTKATLLGMSVRDIAEADNTKLGTDKGVLVAAVHANSIAEQQGIQSDDVIVSINNESVENEREYQQILDKALKQKSVTFRIKRNSGEEQINLKIEYAAAYNNLGNAYVKDKQPDMAIAAYQEAIKIEPKFAEAYYNLGSIYEQQKKYDLAIDNYKKAIANRKDLEEAQYKLTEIYNQQGKHKDAIKIYQELLPASPSGTITSDLRPVEVVHAASGEIKKQLQVSGTIEPRARVTVFPKAVGVIEDLKVDKGSRIEKGQVLAVIEHEELALQVARAQAGVEAAQAGYDQAKQLSEVRVMTQVAQAQAGLTAAESALHQVHALAETRMETQIEQAKAALDALKANLEKIRRGAREEEREQIRATVAQAEANLANVESNHERMQKLFEDGAISKQTFEGIETQLEVAKAQSKVAKQQWKMVEEGAREEDIQAVEAQVKQAEAGFKLAKTQADKQTWQKDIAMAEAQVKQAAAMLESAETLVKAKSWEAEITAAKAQWTQAKVMRDLALKRLADASVKAPIQGIVAQRLMDEGSMANPAAPIFEIVDMDVVKANVDVMESDLRQIHPEDIAWIHVSPLDAPLQARITSVSPTVDERSRTAQVEITVENQKHLLKPGMFAQVSIPTDMRSNTVLLPRSAVIEDEVKGEKYVFVVDSGRSRKTTVEYGLMEGNLVEIVKGLEAEEAVIISGQQNLRDGNFVQIVNVVENLTANAGD